MINIEVTMDIGVTGNNALQQDREKLKQGNELRYPSPVDDYYSRLMLADISSMDPKSVPPPVPSSRIAPQARPRLTSITEPAPRPIKIRLCTCKITLGFNPGK